MTARKKGEAAADTAVVENTAAATEAPADTRSKRQRWREESRISLTEKGSKNPKKPNSMSFDRYEILIATCGAAEGGVATVNDLFRAGYRMDDVRHDSAHGFINLDQPFEI